jgi:hypothetical protein
MNDNERFIELRLPLKGLPYVALLLAACPRFGFERAFDVYRVGAERREDGSVVVIHHLPDADNIYEIDQVKEGQRLRWYAATLKGDPQLHRIRKFGAKLVAQKRMSIRQVLETFAERPTDETSQDDASRPDGGE